MCIESKYTFDSNTQNNILNRQQKNNMKEKPQVTLQCQLVEHQQAV